ncbi:uncharacterized protein [Temnothorax nylanderi]|uniref:uncharacterized protein n=1 Tax=Temnothorax nylanderi TaxID=102681 RepID=UPI003A8B02BF
MTLCLQINLNRHKEAQDLLIHHSEEMGAAVCAVSKPARTSSPHQQWFYSRNALSTIFINTRLAAYPAVLLAQGQNSVLIKYGNIFIASCYISPNVYRGGYSDFLEELSNLFSSVGHNNRLLLCGDFNAHASPWGCESTDFKGELLEDWAAQLDLRLLNVGNNPTFVGHRGSSIIDLTWASPDLSRSIRGWAVRDDMEYMSDHLYIVFEIAVSPSLSQRPLRPPPSRWNFKKMDVELYQAAIEWTCAVSPSDLDFMINAVPDRWIHDCIAGACRAAVPRLQARRSSHAYWWNERIAQLRAASISARRVWTRGRGRDLPEISKYKRTNYVLPNQELKNEIRRAKSEAWKELVSTLDEDPWGLPYKIVLSKLRKSTPGLAVTLEPDILERLLDSLFPPGRELMPTDLGNCEDGRTPITATEVANPIAAKKDCSTAPGPDGFKATALKEISPVMVHRLAQCYNVYMQHGTFPKSWKVADLILIPKGEVPLVRFQKLAQSASLTRWGRHLSASLRIA